MIGLLLCLYIQSQGRTGRPHEGQHEETTSRHGNLYQDLFFQFHTRQWQHHVRQQQAQLSAAVWGSNQHVKKEETTTTTTTTTKFAWQHDKDGMTKNENSNHDSNGQALPQQTEQIVLRVHTSTKTSGLVELALFSHIQVPQHTTLLLPHDLRHKPASTLLQVGFVVFGALPLVYRSVQFMYAYPVLQQVIVGSVVGTIMYGIWSWRAASRTNQALAVSQALQPRVFAQHGAAWRVLQDAATHRVTEALVHEWGQKSSENKATSKFQNDKNKQVMETTRHDPVTRQMTQELMQRWELANGTFQPVPVEEAIQRLRKHVLPS